LDYSKTNSGLEDFGEDSFLEGLRVLLEASCDPQQFNQNGKEMLSGRICQFLMNRLQVQDWLSRHPEIGDETVEKPIIITGLPRTGTTFLQILLSLDPEARSLRYWEATTPCPPPELIHSTVDPRILKFHEEINWAVEQAPNLKAIHPIDAGMFAECQSLFLHEFKSMEFNVLFNVPDYWTWLSQCDMNSAYAYHKTLLKLLQWRLPNDSWVLKAPVHLLSLKVIRKYYPDARIIFTHRDPAKVIASIISLVTTWQKMFGQEINYSEISERWATMNHFLIEKAINERKAFDQQSIFDLYYADFVVDPIGSVQKIYHYFGKEVSSAHEKRMKAWMRDNPQKRRGTHHYSFNDLKVNPEKERERFSAYQQHFNIPIEVVNS